MTTEQTAPVAEVPAAPTNEAPAETPVTEPVTETPEVPPLDLTTVDPFIGILVENLSGKINEHNNDKTRLQQIGGDKQAFSQSVIQSDDPDMVKFREAVEKLDAQKAQIEAARAKLVDEKFEKSRESSKEEIAELSARIDTLAKTITNGRKHLVSEAQAANVDSARVQALLPKVLGNFSGPGGREGMGEGGRKLRNFELTVNGEVALMKNSDGKQVSSFSAAASKIGNKAADVQAAYLAKVGANLDTPAKDLPTGTVEFTVTHENKEYAVTATRQA